VKIPPDENGTNNVVLLGDYAGKGWKFASKYRVRQAVGDISFVQNIPLPVAYERSASGRSGSSERKEVRPNQLALGVELQHNFDAGRSALLYASRYRRGAETWSAMFVPEQAVIVGYQHAFGDVSGGPGGFGHPMSDDPAAMQAAYMAALAGGHAPVSQSTITMATNLEYNVAAHQANVTAGFSMHSAHTCDLAPSLSCL
jgi:hypothetical protein